MSIKRIGSPLTPPTLADAPIRKEGATQPAEQSTTPKKAAFAPPVLEVGAFTPKAAAARTPKNEAHAAAAAPVSKETRKAAEHAEALKYLSEHSWIDRSEKITYSDSLRSQIPDIDARTASAFANLKLAAEEEGVIYHVNGRTNREHVEIYLEGSLNADFFLDHFGSEWPTKEQLVVKIRESFVKTRRHQEARKSDDGDNRTGYEWPARY